MPRQRVIGQRLELGRGKRIRLNYGWCALELKVSLQLENKSVELVKRRLLDRVAERLGPVQMVRIVPVDLPPLQVGPVHYLALGNSQGSIVLRGDTLEQRLYPVEEAGTRVCSDGHATGSQFQTIGLTDDRVLISVQRLADRNRPGRNRQRDLNRAGATARPL